MFGKQNYELNDKVYQYIDWYAENMVSGFYTKTGEYHKTKEMRDFIEKMAVWYELRYPDSEVVRLIDGEKYVGTDVNDEMFYNNEYIPIKQLFPKSTNKRVFEWSNFYNYKAFYSTLSGEEQSFLDEINYPDIVDLKTINTHFHLNKYGIMDETYAIDLRLERRGVKYSFEREQIGEALKYLKEINFSSPWVKEMQKVENAYQKRLYSQEEMLNCVMYRIIERGGNRIGPRRGFLFAKEFNRNIDIPLVYGIDRSDPCLGSFITKYLQAGGDVSLRCLDGYGFRKFANAKLESISISEVMELKNIRYPIEGHIQPLVDVLSKVYKKTLNIKF